MQPPVIIYAFLATIVFYNVGWWVGWYETVVSDEDEARDKKAPVFTGTLCVCLCVCVCVCVLPPGASTRQRLHRRATVDTLPFWRAACARARACSSLNRLAD